MRKVGLIISSVCAIIFPWIILKTGAFGILGGIGGGVIKECIPGFNLTYSNVAFFTVVGMSVLGIITLVLYIFTDGRKMKVTARDFGLVPQDKSKTVSYILKSWLLATIVIAIAFALIKLQEELTGTDFYAWFFGFKSIPFSKIQYYWPYLCIWVPCFLVSGFGMNIERRLPSLGKEWLDNLVAVLVNVFLAEITIVVSIIVIWTLQSNGQPLPDLFNYVADQQRIWGMPAGMAIAVTGNTLLYRKTGNSWLSAILFGSIACLMCVLFGQVRFV